MSREGEGSKGVRLHGIRECLPYMLTLPPDIRHNRHPKTPGIAAYHSLFANTQLVNWLSGVTESNARACTLHVARLLLLGTYVISHLPISLQHIGPPSSRQRLPSTTSLRFCFAGTAIQHGQGTTLGCRLISTNFSSGQLYQGGSH